ncbi:hypothetical protein QZH41_002230 [Actinostola sp. cb2023]|nr:hypothetical protein QZH41_002230 [Actinostola sp. cb2023]
MVGHGTVTARYGHYTAPSPHGTVTARHRHRTVTAPSPHRHRTVTAPSPHRHRTVTAPSPHRHRTVTAPSPHRHRTVTAPSPHRHRTVTAPSPHRHRHRTVTAPSPHRHRTVTAPSPYRHRTVTAWHEPYHLDAELCDASWFHGLLSRDEASTLMKADGLKNGLFMVRKSCTVDHVYMLTFCMNDKIYHCQLLQLQEPFYTKLKQETLTLLARFEEGFEEERDDHDYSVYTGTGGVALLFMHIASTLFKDDLPKKKEYLDKALEILEFGKVMPSSPIKSSRYRKKY